MVITVIGVSLTYINCLKRTTCKLFSWKKIKLKEQNWNYKVIFTNILFRDYIRIYNGNLIYDNALTFWNYKMVWNRTKRWQYNVYMMTQEVQRLIQMKLVTIADMYYHELKTENKEISQMVLNLSTTVLFKGSLL